MSRYADLQAALRAQPARWLVTGAAGFIGSHLVETLLQLGQQVVGLDNFATGQRANLEQLQASVGPAAWRRFTFHEADVNDAAACRAAVASVDSVLHQAALGSVSFSIENPAESHRANVDGFLALLIAARDAGVRRFVYASSCAVYGDRSSGPLREEGPLEPLSPYALTKVIDEQYAQTFARVYGTQSIGLRYFNIYGPRQDPNGPYAAVIPRWIAALRAGERVRINGDGETSRDFCHVADVVQANLLAACAPETAANRVYNVGAGERTTLNELYALLRDGLAALEPNRAPAAREPEYGPFRAGDIRHSLADITQARTLLDYAPTRTAAEGIHATLAWHVRQNRPYAAAEGLAGRAGMENPR